MKGKVKFYNEEKGFGFITSDEDKDYFFHFSFIDEEFRNELKKDSIVEFTEGSNERGPVANEIKIVAGQAKEVEEGE